MPESAAQLELFRAKKPIAYRETSRESFQGTKLGALDSLIVAAIRAAGPAGIICEGIEKKIDRKHQSVAGNLRHLVERGIVRARTAGDASDFGKTSSGRRAIKWVLVERAA